MDKKEETDALDRREFLSKSFKAMVSASVAIIATKVPAYKIYKIEPGEDSTDVKIDYLGGGGTDVIPPHSSHSSRSWR